jgi:hypothetical protein
MGILMASPGPVACAFEDRIVLSMPGFDLKRLSHSFLHMDALESCKMASKPSG